MTWWPPRLNCGAASAVRSSGGLSICTSAQVTGFPGANPITGKPMPHSNALRLSATDPGWGLLS